MNPSQPLVTCYRFSSCAAKEQPVRHYAAELMDKINRGIPLDREDKNTLTRGVNDNFFFKRAIPVCGWAFDFSDVLKLFLVKQYGHWYEMWATDKTAVRAHVYGRIERIVEA
ncbi:molybdenum ABC transporter ATP-binding protein [Neisseria sp. 23W00296]|uniref:molybdenum ABC transporter ATP-binding protein n=1 Tax=unclassified Neisseria TaxID=2623750 RepID=UPI003756A845